MKKKTNCVSVYQGRVKGVRKYKKFYGADAKERAAEYKKRLKRYGGHVPDNYETVTFGQLAEEFIASRTGDAETGRGGLSRSQLDLYRAALKNCGDFQFLKVLGIFPSDVKKLYNRLYSTKSERTGNYLGFQSIKAVKSLVVQVLDEAVQEGYIDRNPAAGIKLRDPMDKTARLGRRYLNDEERAVIASLGRILYKYKDDDYTLFFGGYLLLYSGLRKGELIPLRVEDINLKERYIDINKAVEKIPSGKYEIKAPKTLNSVRKVFITPHILPLIKAYIDLNKLKPKDLLLRHKGKMFTESTFRDAWDKYTYEIYANTVKGMKYIKERDEFNAKLSEEEIKDGKAKPRYPEDYRRITPHAFRRTNCMILGEMGVDVKTAQLQLGHADIRTTLEIYQSVQDSVRKKQVESFEIKPPELSLDDFLLSKGLTGLKEAMTKDEIIELINKVYPGEFVDKSDYDKVEEDAAHLTTMFELFQNRTKKDEK